MNDERLDDLEIKYSHLEIEVEKLQRTVFAQDTVLQKLEQTLKLLREKLDAMGRGDGIPGPAGEKPPHY